MFRPSLRAVFVSVAAGVALVQLLAVTFAALPTNRYSEAVAPATGHLDPYFTQNWRLFAPNPIAEDRSVLLQGVYVDVDGASQVTPWVDWTSVELGVVHHRLVGGRAGYITNKLYTPLQGRFAALTATQQAVATDAEQVDPPTWSELGDALVAADGNVPAVQSYLRYERATTQLATEVLTSRWPGHTFTAVRHAVRSQGVTPYVARGGSDSERAAARPAVEQRDGGWRRPSPGSDAAQRSIADFDRRHR